MKIEPQNATYATARASQESSQRNPSAQSPSPNRRSVNSSPRRLGPLLSTLALVVAACGSAGVAIPISSTGSGPAVPDPTTAAAATDGPATTLLPTTSPPRLGNTDGRFPELSVSPADPGYIVELLDPEAKAWKILVVGSGDLATDRLELLVEVGDTAPGIEVRTIVDGKVVDATDLTGLVGDETAAAGGCHPTLQICYGSGGMTIDPAKGLLEWVLERIEPGRFQIGGATASWPGEPFILGPWRTTEVFQTE